MRAASIRPSQCATLGDTPSLAAASRAALATSCKARRSASLHESMRPAPSMSGGAVGIGPGHMNLAASIIFCPSGGTLTGEAGPAQSVETGWTW